MKRKAMDPSEMLDWMCGARWAAVWLADRDGQRVHRTDEDRTILRIAADVAKQTADALERASAKGGRP